AVRRTGAYLRPRRRDIPLSRVSAPAPSVGAARRRPAREPKIAILVVGCLLPVYGRCIRAIRSTWGSRSIGSVDIYYVYGGQRVNLISDLMPIEALIGQPRPTLHDHEVWVSGDIILCGTADLDIEQRDCVLRKRLIAFGYLAGHARYEFVYTVCACSYVDVDVLRRYVDGLPADGVYQGPLGIHGPSGVPFVSGASMLLSRDLAAALSSRAQAI